MRRITCLLCLVALAAAWASPVFGQDIQAELDDLVRRWTEALNAEEIDEFLACYWDDALRITYFPGNEPEITEGMTELRAAEQASFQQMDFLSFNLVYDEPVRFFPRRGRPTYLYPNSALGYMDVFEFEDRRGEFRIIAQYLIPHPQAE